MRETAASHVPKICSREGLTGRIDAAGVTDMPHALGRLIIYDTMHEASGTRAVSFKHVEAALGLCRDGGPPFDVLLDSAWNELARTSS